MNRRTTFLPVFMAFIFTFHSISAFASLSSSLGATDLRGLGVFTDCINEAIGYREGIIGDRLELKLGQTGPELPPAERQLYMAEINALKLARAMKKAYVPPDPKNSQHYMLGLSGPEQQALNSMWNRYNQENQLRCEQLHGGMLRYSSTSDQSGQYRYEQSLRDKMGQVIDINSIPVGPIEKEKTQAEREAEDKARFKDLQALGMQNFNQCMAASKGLRVKIVAQMLQGKLNNSSTLSPKERAEFEQDVQSAWMSAGKGLDMIESADPKNPMRAEMRLNPEEMNQVNMQFAQQNSQIAQSCAQGAVPRTSM